MKIAIEGCAHGELDIIYECVETLKEKSNIVIDLLICCGDFQSVRNHDDLCAMAVPQKYQNMCSFYKYYSGAKKAPVLTLFIGGNHEASNYLQELPYGGWVAPKIYYLGRAGVVKFGDLRIGGLSGIFNGRDYNRGLWECPPYNENSKRSVYHVRSLDVFRLKQLGEHVDIMLSHDWPLGITHYGNKAQLLRRKPYFKDEIESNRLGSPPCETLLNTLKPEYWFSAHLHCQFAALVRHIQSGKETKFLALDKCLPKRRHLQILEVNGKDGDKMLKYDEEWLAILRSTNHLISIKDIDSFMPGPGGNERYEFTPTEDDKRHIKTLFNDNLEISVDSFVKTAPDFSPNAPKIAPTQPILNPQTQVLCETIGIDDPIHLIMSRTGRSYTTDDSLKKLTLPKTPRMILPSPMKPIVEDFKDDNESLGTNDVSMIVSDDPLQEEITPKKTFKRRNETIYSSIVSTSEVNSEQDIDVSESRDNVREFKKRNNSLYGNNDG